MLKKQTADCKFIAAAGLAAGLVFWPSSVAAAEPQISPAIDLEAVEIEAVPSPEWQLSGMEIETRRAAKDTSAVQGSASQRPIEPRQLALIVILLSTLGVATRLLWRRHLRALSLVQDENVDEK